MCGSLIISHVNVITISGLTAESKSVEFPVLCLSISYCGLIEETEFYFVAIMVFSMLYFRMNSRGKIYSCLYSDSTPIKGCSPFKGFNWQMFQFRKYLIIII